MTILLLRLTGPMQSWGTYSRFTVRDAGTEPSKSGVIGLLCSALGRTRDEPVDDLANLKMGVRVDREGVVSVDYHTAGGTHRKGESYGVLKATGLVSRDAVTSNRYYLADADFLIGFSGDGSLLQEARRAIAEPVMQTYLGRKSFVPATPVHIPDGFRTESDLESALVRYPWPRLGVRVPGKRPDRLRFVIEADNSESGEIRRDQPVGAAFLHRRFLLRHVKTSFHALGDEVPIREE